MKGSVTSGANEMLEFVLWRCAAAKEERLGPAVVFGRVKGGPVEAVVPGRAGSEAVVCCGSVVVLLCCDVAGILSFGIDMWSCDAVVRERALSVSCAVKWDK